MKDIVIFGDNDFGRMLKYYLEIDDNRRIVAFTVDKKYWSREQFCGLKVIPFEEIDKYYSPEKYEILIAIGNSKMNQVREDVFGRIKEKGYTVASYIHSSCSVHTKEIGEGNIMLENCIVYPFSKIGKGNLLWDNVSISHDGVVGDFNTFAGYSDMCGYVKIGNNCFFGKHCILDNYMVVEDYVLVGAGTYARGKTKKYDVIVPARSQTLKNKKSIDIM